MENKNSFSNRVSIHSLSNSEKDYISKALENPSACSLCGCVGIHACIGYHVVWTEEDKNRLKIALAQMFGWEEKHE